MPSEMASPVTTAVAAHTPICRLLWGSTSMVWLSYGPAAWLRISLWMEMLGGMCTRIRCRYWGAGVGEFRLRFLVKVQDVNAGLGFRDRAVVDLGLGGFALHEYARA